jgi:hypothetical protein
MSQFDAFLSYRRLDKEPVKRLEAAMQRLGLHVWRDEAEIEDFAGIQRSISTGLANAKALVVWYSKAYNESRACRWELTAAYVAAQHEGDPRRPDSGSERGGERRADTPA